MALLDFLEKESTRFRKELKLLKDAYISLQLFKDRKNRGDALFDLLTVFLIPFLVQIQYFL